MPLTYIDENGDWLTQEAPEFTQAECGRLAKAAETFADICRERGWPVPSDHFRAILAAAECLAVVHETGRYVIEDQEHEDETPPTQH